MTARRVILGAIAACAAAVSVGQAADMSLDDCVRVVRGWNGWEVGHRDLGGGRVAFGENWAAEGVYFDLIATDCATGETVRTRLREEMVKPRPAFDRRKRGLEVLERHGRRSPALFSIGALAEDLSDIGVDTAISENASEVCACAVLYPDLRGDKTAFEGI